MQDESVKSFLGAIASPTPTPGGGTASATLGALGCALGEMVAGLTIGKEKFRPVEAEMQSAAKRLAEMREAFLRLMVEDAESFEAILRARRLPKGTDEERSERERMVQEALVRASEVPLATAKLALEALELLHALSQKGNPSAATDVGAGALSCHGAVLSAVLNVRINATAILDPKTRELFETQARTLEVKAGQRLTETLLAVQRHLGT